MHRNIIKRNYRGRFAPSPTGGLHLGSLVSALASFLDAKVNQGEWLVRMEDIDPPREQEGAAQQILHSLDEHCLQSEFPVIWQSEQGEYYQRAIEQLWQQGDLYRCACSSKQIKQYRSQNEHCLCRDKKNDSFEQLNAQGYSLRIKVEAEKVVGFKDCQYGLIEQNIYQEAGDFIIRRRDGLFAYQLAVVVDDALQGITNVVRGVDLLDVTPRQIYLQQKLGFSTPAYRHIPLVYDEQGNKLSKQNFSPILNSAEALQNLQRACNHLKIAITKTQKIESLLNQAIAGWGKI